MVGVQAGDIVRVVNYLKRQRNVDPRNIGAIAYNEMCLPLVHAAAFDTSINNIALIGSLISYQSIAMNKFHKIGITKRPNSDYWHPVEVDFSWGIASVLTAYDLPDLIGSIVPRRVVLADLRDQMLEPAPSELINKEMEFPLSVYAKQAPGKLKILDKIDDLNAVLKWGFE